MPVEPVELLQVEAIDRTVKNTQTRYAKPKTETLEVFDQAGTLIDEGKLDISGDEFVKLGYKQGQTVHLTIGKNAMNIPFVRTFSDVSLKQSLLYIDSRGHLGLAVNQASFAEKYQVKPPTAIFITRAK